MAIDFSKSEEFVNPLEDKNLLDKAIKGGTTGLAAYGIAKYGKRAIARGIDTYGFGNVSGSYAGESKIAQYTNNLLSASGGKRRKMPLEMMKTLISKGNPAEINALKSSLTMVEDYMSKLRSQNVRIPKKVTEYYLNLKTMEPERKMAQAILQKSFNQPIGFKHGGKFIHDAMPQLDPDIGKALSNKGFNIKKPFTVFDVSDDKFMVKKLRAASTGDPRVQEITKALKQNRVNDAKRIAKKGQFKYKGEIVKGGRPLKLIKEGNGYVLKIVPQFVKRGGKLASVKEYVVGGHTQRIHFRPFKGVQGFHKATTDMFDITSYASAGEKSSNLLQKGRIVFAGEAGRALKVHQPIITTATFNHRAPGGGRTVGAFDMVKRKKRKFVESSAKTYTKVTKKIPWKKLAKFIFTKGRRF